MKSEERRLSNWLHETTPEPPRVLTTDAIADRLARPAEYAHPRRRWLPLVAASSVVAIAAAIALAVTLPDHPSGSPPPAATAPNSSHPKSASSTHVPVRTSVALGSWTGTAVDGPAADAVPLLGAGTSLYALQDQTLLKIDAASGRVLARTTAPDNGVLTELALVADTLWINPSVPDAGPITLHGYDPRTLALTASIRLAFGSAGQQFSVVPLTAASNDRDLFLGLGATIDVVDAVTRQVVKQFTVRDGYVQDVALSADASALYVAVKTGEMDSRIDVLDPITGTRRATRAINGANIVNNVGLVASAGGVWVQTGGGMQDSVGFLAGPDLTPAPGAGVVGGRPITVTVADGAVWIAEPDFAVCADPASGRVRAHTEIPPHDGSTAYLGSVAFAGRQLFSTYSAGAPHDLLVRLRPSSRCTP